MKRFIAIIAIAAVVFSALLLSSGLDITGLVAGTGESDNRTTQLQLFLDDYAKSHRQGSGLMQCILLHDTLEAEWFPADLAIGSSK